MRDKPSGINDRVCKAVKFWSQVDRRSTPDGCWEWMGRRFNTGYGVCRENGKGYGAHRVSYEAATGQEPGSLLVMHSCDNPPCVRPDHLSLGTNADNTRDMIRKGRAWWSRQAG